MIKATRIEGSNPSISSQRNIVQFSEYVGLYRMAGIDMPLSYSTASWGGRVYQYITYFSPESQEALEKTIDATLRANSFEVCELLAIPVPEYRIVVVWGLAQ